LRHIKLRLSLAQAASGLIGGAYTPFFGAWLAWRGLSPGQIGVLLASGMLLRVLVAPVTGLVADARNDRRGMMLFLYAIVFAGYAGLNVADAFVPILFAALPANVAGGAITPLLESVSVRLSERFGFDYGHVRLWASTVFVLGNVGSGILVSMFGMVVIAPWLTVAVAFNLLAIYALPAPPVDRPRTHFSASLRATMAEAQELLRSRVFVIFLVAASLDQGSHAFYYGYGGLHWRAIGYSGTLIGIIWPLGVLAEIGLMAISLKVFRVLGATRLLLLGGVACAVRWAALAFDPPLPYVVFAQLLHGATFAMAHLGAMYFILKAVPPRLAATAQSLYAVASFGIVMGAATYACGPLYAAAGGRTYLLMALMGVGSAAVAFWLGRAWHGGRVMTGVSEEAVETI
jgi:PPP family 3-phenylpropionic acid transporter